jgi:hypothetical protein
MSDSSALPLNGEEAISVSTAARLFAGQRGAMTIHPSTITRWLIRGVRKSDGTRVKLEGFRLGAKWLTSKAALYRFAVALTPPDTPDEQPVRSPAARRKASERAEAELAAAGC